MVPKWDSIITFSSGLQSTWHKKNFFEWKILLKVNIYKIYLDYLPKSIRVIYCQFSAMCWKGCVMIYCWYDFILFYIADRKEMNGNDLGNITEPDELLDYLDKKYFVYKNIVYLQGLFLACKAPHLYDRCVQYAKNGERYNIFRNKNTRKR